MRLRFAVLATLSLLSIAHAADEEIASDGDAVRLFIPDNYQCSSTSLVKIVTKSAAYFDQDAEEIQRLANVAGGYLSFKCNRIDKIEFSGFTDNVLVFKAIAEAKDTWAMQTDPAPLEALALLFSLYEPSFFNLATLDGQLDSYLPVTGIKKTYQFQAFTKEAGRISAIIDGDPKNFREYLKNPGYDLGDFDNANKHYQSLLASIKKYAPTQYPKYKAEYDQLAAGLKRDYWASLISQTLENETKTAREKLTDIEKLAKQNQTIAFKTFVDEQVKTWILNEFAWIQESMADAPLFEVGIAADELAELGEPKVIPNLPKTSSELSVLHAKLLGIITKRLIVLEGLGNDVVKESGSTYLDVDTVLETAFALAEEFEEAGYPASGERLLANSFTYINSMLEVGLKGYKSDLKALKLSGTTAIALQEQVILFEELSRDFPGFSDYQNAAEQALQSNKGAICEGILKGASVNKLDFEKQIFLGSKKITLSVLACDLFENDHIVSGFKWAWKPGQFILSIKEADGQETSFRFVADKVMSGQNLRIQERLLGEGSTPMSAKEWEGYVVALVLPPPSGKPDTNGVRECDTLGADPDDPKKLAVGVDLNSDDLDLDLFERAIDACVASVENTPDDPRQQFQLGRLLWAAGDQETASEYINLAASVDYPPAIFYQAEILFATSDDPDAFIDALGLFEKAGKLSYAPGTAMVKELNPDGLNFFKETPPPTKQGLFSAIDDKYLSVSAFGMSQYAKVVDVDVKSCMQMGADEFSCEYRRVLKCGITGNAPITPLLSMAWQADCTNNFPDFSTFRKLDNGTWKEFPVEF